jgi:hypothetical protein
LLILNAKYNYKTNVMKKTTYILCSLFLLGALPAFAQDDLYYDPAQSASAQYSEPSSNNVGLSDNTADYRAYEDNSGSYNNGYEELDDYTYDNDYYDNHYDYYYASRIRRFHRPLRYSGFYNPYYSDVFFYDPFFSPGLTIYIGPSWGWNRSSWNNPYHYSSWNSWNYYPSYYYNSWAYCPSSLYGNNYYYGNYYNNNYYNKDVVAYGSRHRRSIGGKTNTGLSARTVPIGKIGREDIVRKANERPVEAVENKGKMGRDPLRPSREPQEETVRPSRESTRPSREVSPERTRPSRESTRPSRPSRSESKPSYRQPRESNNNYTPSRSSSSRPSYTPPSKSEPKSSDNKSSGNSGRRSGRGN